MNDNTGLDLFISALIKHPEFSAVRYDAGNEEITIEIAIEGVMDVSASEQLNRKIKKYIKAYHQLKNNCIGKVDILFKEMYEPRVTLMRYIRDVNTLDEIEIDIFADMLEEEYDDIIIRDSGTRATGEGYKQQIKNNLIKKINRKKEGASNFTAYRDDGKVLVFNQ